MGVDGSRLDVSLAGSQVFKSLVYQYLLQFISGRFLFLEQCPFKLVTVYYLFTLSAVLGVNTRHFFMFGLKTVCYKIHMVSSIHFLIYRGSQLW